MMMNRDEKFMSAAINLAKNSAEFGEVPVGALIVKDNKIISVGYNLRENSRNAAAHAEMMAINNACILTKSWRLSGCELFVTLEPCPMCAGAVINSRISRVVFGAYDLKAGSCGSKVNLFELNYNHKPELVGGVLEEECADLLKNFFKGLR